MSPAFSSHLFDLLAQGSTVTLSKDEHALALGWLSCPFGTTYCTILASDADLACAFCLWDVSVIIREIVGWIGHHCGCPLRMSRKCQMNSGTDFRLLLVAVGTISTACIVVADELTRFSRGCRSLTLTQKAQNK